MSQELVGRLWRDLGGEPRARRPGTADRPAAGAALGLRCDRAGRQRPSPSRRSRRPPFHAVRGETAVPPVTVDRRARRAAFFSEGLFTPVGWDSPPGLGPDRRRLPGRRRLDPAAHQLPAPPRRGRARARPGRRPDATAARRSPAGPPTRWRPPWCRPGGCAAAMYDRADLARLAARRRHRRRARRPPRDPARRARRAPAPPRRRSRTPASACST